MPELLEQLRVPTLLNYLRQLPSTPYLGDELFPERTVNELEYKYLVGANNLPVAATVIPFDSEAPIHSRDGADIVQGKIPAIKRKARIDEETLLKLFMPRENTNEFDDAIAEIYDDVKLLTESVRAGIELLRMRALTTGKIEITDAETGVRLAADYGLDATQKITCDGKSSRPAAWSDATNRKILDNLLAWAGAVEDLSGIRPERMVISRNVLNYMLADQTIRDSVWNAANTKRPIVQEDLVEVLRRNGLPTQIAVYEKKVRVQAANGTYTTTRLFPDNLCVLLPGDKLGDTLFAPTAEALRQVRAGAVNFGDAKGIFGEVWETNEPPAHWTKVAALAFPTFPRAGEVVIANVDPS